MTTQEIISATCENANNDLAEHWDCDGIAYDEQGNEIGKCECECHDPSENTSYDPYSEVGGIHG